MAPSSAPMLQIVPFPVALMVSAPGAKIFHDLVRPPFTVSNPQR